MASPPWALVSCSVNQTATTAWCLARGQCSVRASSGGMRSRDSLSLPRSDVVMEPCQFCPFFPIPSDAQVCGPKLAHVEQTGGHVSECRHGGWAGLFRTTPLGEGVLALGDELTQTLKPTASLSGMKRWQRKVLASVQLIGHHPLCPGLSWPPSPPSLSPPSLSPPPCLPLSGCSEWLG